MIQWSAVPRIPGLAAGVGLGWRTELAAPLLAAPRSTDFIEVIAEACFAGAPLAREVMALHEIWKGGVLPHGIKLSLGSADGIDVERARRLGALTRELRAPVVSEHVAFTRGRSALKKSREIGHLTQLPLTRTALAVVTKNVAQARRHLPDVPFLLETPAWTLRWPDDEMGEGDFFCELVRMTGCDLLIDLANIHANAINSNLDAHALLRSYPLPHVAMVHLAGGAMREGFYVDTHAHAVPDAVFTLLDELLAVTGPLPIVIERDGNFPPFSELAGEVERARGLMSRGEKIDEKSGEKLRSAETGRPPSSLPFVAAGDPSIARLAAQQGHLAELLTARETPAVTAPFDEKGVANSRSILHYKRLDESRYEARFANGPRPRGASGRFAWARRFFGR